MNRYLVLLVSTLISYLSFGQESFRKVYKIPNKIILKDNSEISLKEVIKVNFKNLNDKEKDSIENLFPLGSKINYQIEKNILGKKVTVSETIIINKKFYEKQTFKKIKNVTKTKIRGFVKFSGNKVIVNPYLKKNKKGNFGKKNTYYYKLNNRESIKLSFNEWTVSALTIPFKYRFKDKSSGISEEFTTDFNANLFIGRTFRGKTSFFYRKDVGNIINNFKWTWGLLLGTSTITLDANNTSASEFPLNSNTEAVKGLATIGLGLSFSYNKINFGGFLGWDYSIGDHADKWNYNKKPWIGFALGYSLFKI